MKNAALGYQPTSATASTSTTSESPLVSNTNVSNHSDTTTPRTTSITPRAPKRIVAPNSNSSNNTTRHAFTLSKYQRRHVDPKTGFISSKPTTAKRPALVLKLVKHHGYLFQEGIDVSEWDYVCKLWSPVMEKLFAISNG
ncbi:hypothetical protein BDF21DRAFT_467413 [Thamnidium elegans]|nr:hypothetical protein BDF21DRAFT_467413 [Thamnidium elegans]